MKNKLLILPSIFFLLILSIFFYLLIIDRNPSELPSTLLDKNVPKFETKSLLKDENFISPKEFQNEIILVNFFATWCKPCRDEHMFIKRFSDEKGIKIIERKIKPDEMSNFSGCFLTGTAAEVTPVSQIDKYKFNVSNVIKDLSESYQALVQKKTAA